MSLSDLIQKIDSFVERTLHDYKPAKTDSKVIHDAIWGSNIYYPWEISLLDSPLLQRLRDIRQTGLAFHTYPTAGHSRFEHTLGVITLAERIARSINSKQQTPLVKQSQIYALRLAGLFHDIGHTFFSHLTEIYYSELPEFKGISKEINRQYKRSPKGHEILSFLITKSAHVRNLWEKIKKLYGTRFLKDINLDEVAGYIISYAKDPSLQYMADIINGTYDVDKLDYLARDAKFCGVSIGYDFERYLTTIMVNVDKASGKQKLFIPVSGINALEQIIINKLMLFGYIYHHQKVRICELMFKYMLHRIFTHCTSIQTAEENWIDLRNITDFLNYTDSDFWSGKTLERLEPPDARQILKNLITRNIPKRALRISRLYIRNFETDDESLLENYGKDPEKSLVSPGYRKFYSLCDSWSELLKLREDIFKAIPVRKRKKIHIDDIWIDIPKEPISKEAEETMIPLDKKGTKLMPLNSFFPIGEWVKGYRHSKWKAHIYTEDRFIGIVRDASRIVLKEKFNMELSELADI